MNLFNIQSAWNDTEIVDSDLDTCKWRLDNAEFLKYCRDTVSKFEKTIEDPPSDQDNSGGFASEFELLGPGPRAPSTERSERTEIGVKRDRMEEEPAIHTSSQIERPRAGGKSARLTVAFKRVKAARSAMASNSVDTVPDDSGTDVMNDGNRVRRSTHRLTIYPSSGNQTPEMFIYFY